ncbi:uncharacterized protein LOC135370262 [Ornithodoros turicata]|uniref:uncharacterized protein LOC135370262 n=1 Tax=Ornithodoros turicata TaxID=34597 RepID=UPI003139CF31
MNVFLKRPFRRVGNTTITLKVPSLCVRYTKPILFTTATTFILLSVIASNEEAFPKLKFVMEGRQLEPKVRGYVVDTEGCRIPDFDPFDDSVIDCYKPVSPYKCDARPSFIQQKGNVLLLDTHILKIHYNITPEHLRCTYSIIKRNDSIGNSDYVTVYGGRRILQFGRPIRAEYVRVRCKHAAAATLVDDFFMFPVLKADVEHRCENAKPSKDHMNIVFLGLDSVSRLNSLRQLRKTRKYLYENLDPIELYGFNKAGDNSFPNQLAMLTGQSEAEGNAVCRKGFYDDQQLIWKTYSQMGYRTMFLEETPRFGLFTYLCKGFHQNPTDYYPRPFMIALELSGVQAHNISSGPYCVGSRLQSTMYLEYTTSLLALLRDRPYFTYTWLSDLSHDELNSAGYADQLLRNTLETLSNTGILNRSLVILLSDHGLRYGAIRGTLMGKYEDRLPFSFFLFPPSFRKEYPEVMQNLRINQHRLTTPYDVHATLLELTTFPRTMAEPQFPTERGLSLLHEIPRERTCSSASIPPHYCCCRTHEDKSICNALAWSIAKFLVRDVNEKLDKDAPGLCETHRLVAVLDVRKISTGGGTDYFLVTVSTTPGEVIIEGTVGVVGNGNFTVDNISRLTLYRGQSHCARTRLAIKLCVCK